jgi:hypothetical protein
VRAGNPDLKWETSAELNAGVEWSMFGNRFYGEANYFNEYHNDIIGTNGTIYTDQLGQYTVARNIGRTRNRGVDASINWKDGSGSGFTWEVGVNFLYSRDEVLSMDELPNMEEARKTVGKSSGSMFGLQSSGLYGRDVQLAGAPRQNFGPYQAGDIAYADQTGDGIVDDRDMVRLGNNFPATVWGVKADLHYGNWGLYLLATAETGASVWMNSSYHWNRGTGKYSALTLDRYHPANNPDGEYPRLTTTDGANNFRNSSFWIEKADFLRLKNVELSYTFSARRSGGVPKQIKVFARGTNLAVLTGLKDLDPEMPAAGITAYPVYSTCTGGVSVTF